MSTLTHEKTRCRRLNQTKMKMQCWGENKVCNVEQMIDGLTINHSLAPFVQTKVNVGTGYWGNGVIFQDGFKRCVVMDVHQRSLQTWGIGNCQTFKIKVNFFNYEKKAILSYMKVWLKEVGPSSTWETHSSKLGLLKIQNLEHMYGTTKT